MIGILAQTKTITYCVFRIPMYSSYQHYLSTLQKRNQYRQLGQPRDKPEPVFLDFSTNDYLNLSQSDAVKKAAIEAMEIYGVGATGSRLLSGNIALAETLERTIAKDKNTDTSLVFNSGFQANVSTLACLLDEAVLRAKPIVFFDKWNHASLYQAVFLRQPELCRYRRHQLSQLEALLESYKNDPRPKFIVTESVFGMDGDVAPLEEIVQLARYYNTFLYLDEAHATGVLGEYGYGLSTSLALQGIPHVIMGSFSKALGCSGGYIACSQEVYDFLVNRASGFIYSTAPSPMVIGAVLKAWQMVKTLDQERLHLRFLASRLRQSLHALGLDTGLSSTHIVPIHLQEETACLEAKAALLQENIMISAIRPPTVPPKSSRLRIALTTNHTEADIERLAANLAKVLKK